MTTTSSTSHHDAGDVLVPPPPQTADTFPMLDTFRALGALCVVTTHAAFWAGDYTRHGVLGTVLARLDVGVAIFFVLSGFLLSRAWLVRAADGRPAPAVAPYLWRRGLRILPIYVVTVVLALTLIGANRDRGVGQWVSTLLMLDVFHGAGFPDGLTQMWSLSAEVCFYLVLPVVMWALLGRAPGLRPGRVAAGLAVLAVVSLWWHADGAARIGAGQPLQWLPAFLTWFAAGVLLALVQVLHARGRGARWVRPFVSLARQPGACWTLIVGLMLVSATPLAGPTMLAAPTTAESLTKHVVYAAVGFLVVLTGVFPQHESTYARIVGAPLGRRLGWISYGVFCLHLPILHLVMWTTGWSLFVGRGPAIWAITVVLSLAAAEVGYRLVERPALRLKNRVREPAEVTSRPVTTTTST